MKKSVLLPLLILSVLTSSLLYFVYTTKKQQLLAHAFTTLTTSLTHNKKIILNYIEQEKSITYNLALSNAPLQSAILISPQGKIVSQSYPIKKTLKNSPEEDLFTTTLLTKKPTVTSTLFDPFLQKPALLCAAPRTDGTEISHILIRQIPLHNLLAQLDYSALGSTGDIVIAKQTFLGTVFINNTRFAPDEKSKTFMYSQGAYASTQGLTIPQDHMPLIHDTLAGKPSQQKTTDYRLKSVLAVSDIIPELNWALVIQQDMSTALAPIFPLFIFLIVSLVLSLIFCLATISFFIRYPQELIILTFCTVFLLGGSGYLWYIRHALITQPFEQIIQKETTTLNTLAHEIQNSLRTLEIQSEQLLNELTKTHTTSTAHLQLQLSTFLENLPMALSCILVTPTTINMASKQNGSLVFTELTQQNSDLQKLSATPTGIWLENNQDPLAKITTPVFGIASESLKLYCFYNPLYLATRIRQEKTTEDAQTILFSSQLSPFYDSTTHTITTSTPLYQKLQTTLAHLTEPQGMLTMDDGYIFYKTIPQRAWIIASYVPTTQIPLQTKHITSITLWFLCLLAAAFSLALCIMCFIKKWSFSRLSAGISIILTLTTAFSWYLISSTITTIPAEQFSVTTTSEIQRVEEILFDDALLKQTTLVPPIPTGIVLQDITVSPFQTMNIVGHMWQKYDLIAHKNISHGIRIAQTFKSNIIETYKTHDGTTETIGWDFSVEMAAPEADIRYPFDCKKFELKLEHPDKTKHILLIPDLTAYDKTEPHHKPGIGRTVNLPGFVLQKSFFNYQPTTLQASIATRTLAPVLAFSTLAQRLIMDALIMYLLPLFIIILALFLVEYLAERNREKNPELEFYFSVFNMYTALFFTLVLMHRSLRTELPSGGEIIFIEYFFFSTYIILLGLLLLALARPRGIKIMTKYGTFSLVKHLYWPVQALIVLGATLWMFA